MTTQENILQENKVLLAKRFHEFSTDEKTKNLIQTFICLPANIKTHNFIKRHKGELFKPYSDAGRFIDTLSFELICIIAFTRKELCEMKESSAVKKYIADNDSDKTIAFKYKEGFVILSPDRILQAEYIGDPGWRRLLPDKIENIDEASYVIWLRRNDLEKFLNKYNEIIRMAVLEQIREDKKQRNIIIQITIKQYFRMIVNIVLGILSPIAKLKASWVIIIALIVCFVTFNSGFNKGKMETYEPTKIIAIQTYEAEIIDLRKQIDDSSKNYERDIAVLQQIQTQEINTLGKTQSNEIYALGKKQTTEIVNLQKDKESELGFTQAKHENEIKETQETYYVRGQVDTRSNIQNQIDSKFQENMSNNDWDAPVFSTRR